MKNCLRLTFFVCLLLPTLAAAQEKPVQVPNACEEGTPFTIKIPIKAHGMTVQYAWEYN